jgi:hypothetical protein
MNFMQNHTKIIIAIDCKIKVALIFMPYLVQMVQFICPENRAGSLIWLINRRLRLAADPQTDLRR